MAVGADVAAGSLIMQVTWALWLCAGPSWGTETKQNHLFISRGPAQVPVPPSGKGIWKDERQSGGCSTDVTCWGSVALASKCHVWQLVCCFLPHQLLAVRLLKERCERCLHQGRPNGMTLKRIAGSCLS